MWAIIIPSLVTTVGFIVTIINTNAKIKSASAQQRELTVKEKAEETYSTIQEIMDVANSIMREVAIFIDGKRWSTEQLQDAYSRLLKPINKLRLLLYLYFPKIVKTYPESLAAAYNLVEALKGYAVQHTEICIGDFKCSSVQIVISSGQVLDYDSFRYRYTNNIEELNKLLDKFAKDVSKVLTSDDFV